MLRAKFANDVRRVARVHHEMLRAPTAQQGMLLLDPSEHGNHALTKHVLFVGTVFSVQLVVFNFNSSQAPTQDVN
jgi:hypothetical protein